MPNRRDIDQIALRLAEIEDPVGKARQPALRRREHKRIGTVLASELVGAFGAVENVVVRIAD
jgi:hypothetical protein